MAVRQPNSIRMLLGTCALLIGGCWVAAAQAPVQQEPHHRVLFENAALRVLDVNIEPGGTTLEHRHDNDIMTVSVSASETRVRTPAAGWGDIRPRRRLGETNLTEYAGQSGTHTVQNVGESLYRLIAVENLKQAGWSVGSAVTGAGTTLLNDARAFRTYAVQLGTTENGIDRVHCLPTVVVLVTGEAIMNRNGSPSIRLDQSRRWVVVAAGESYRLTRGTGDVRFVEIEVR